MKFSIVLPTIGRDSLAATVASVIAQDHQDWEMTIVCDGGCGPHPTDQRIVIIGVVGQEARHDDSGAWARNWGINMTQNPWIAYIDDDDIWHPNHLSTLSSLLVASPHATMLRTAGQAFSWRRKSPRTKKHIRRLGAVNSTDILTVGMAHTRELFLRTQGWRPQDNHDKLLWNEMLEKGGVVAQTDLVTFEFER